MRYSEANGRGGRSTRHTAIYHQHADVKNSTDIVICLQPTQSPGFDKCLEKLRDGSQLSIKTCTDLCVEPLLLHAMLFSSHSSGWKVHNRQLGEDVSQKVRERWSSMVVSNIEVR